MPVTKLKVGKLSDESILRIARMRVSESAAGVFTQLSADTQLSVERGVIWMIHFVEFTFENLVLLNEVAAAAVERVEAQLTRDTKTLIVTGDDTDIIQQCTREIYRSAAIGTDAGPLYWTGNAQVRYDFPMPVPYAAQNLFLGIQGTHASSAHTVSARVGYSIREVDDQFFFRVASALLG